MSPSERLAWAADVVAPRPGERLLEVGCGHGVLVDLLAGRGADVVAIDRSATMTAAAARRNAAAVAAGRVRLVTGSLADVDPGGPFDAVVSFDVRAFWTPPSPEWDVAVRVLATGGRAVVAFSVMDPTAAGRIEDAVRTLAGTRGLVPAAVHRGATRPHPSVAVELRRPPSPG
jgi:cyclopropane fatty-acyl-phospholipid synthase-like methyltransferase